MAADSAAPRRLGRTPAAALTILIALFALALPLIIAGHYGALGIPRSDDWSYLVTEFRVADGGPLSFNHWVSMSLVGQLVISAPVGALWPDSITALQGLTAVLGTVGVVAVWATGRAAGVAPAAAGVLALTITLGPLWGPLAASYMTDLPAFAFSSLALYLAVRAVTRRPVALPWLAAAAVVGLVAFTIRQYAIVAAVVPILTGIWWFGSRGDIARVRRTAIIGAGIAVAAAAFWLWWRTIPDVRSLGPSAPDVDTVRTAAIKIAGFLRLAGLLLAPVIVMAGPRALVEAAWRISRRGVLAVAGLGVVLLGVTAAAVPADLYVGNYLMADGVLSDIVVIGPRPDVLPTPVWIGFAVIAELAALVLMIATVPAFTDGVARLRAREFALRDPVNAVLGITVVGYSGAYVLAVLTGIQVYDRYLLPVLGAIGLLTLRAGAAVRTGRRSPVPVVVTVVALAGLGLAFSADSASFDGARWKAATRAVEAGWSPRQVNGGFEWVNFHRGDKLDHTGLTPAQARRARRRAGDPTLCVTVHVDPARVSPSAVVAVVESTAPTRDPARLVAYRIPGRCPAGPGASP